MKTTLRPVTGNPVTNRVFVEFASPEVLADFLSTINDARVMSPNGDVMRFDAEGNDPGHAHIRVTFIRGG